MWPFRKKPPEPPPPPPERYDTIDYQVNDEVVCINDDPHEQTHQRLLSLNAVYKVRHIQVGPARTNGYCGPWARLEGVVPVGDSGWLGSRFKKTIKMEKKSQILEQVLEPCDLDVEREKKLAEHLLDAPA